MEEKCGKCGKFRHRSQRSLTLARHISANLGTSRHISAHLDSISESRPVIEVRGIARHISAQLGASRSRGQSSTGKVCEDAPDWQCGTLSRTSLRLTQHSFTRNGPREGGYAAKHTSSGAHVASAVSSRFARRSVARERECQRRRHAYTQRTKPELRGARV